MFKNQSTEVFFISSYPLPNLCRIRIRLQKNRYFCVKTSDQTVNVIKSNIVIKVGSLLQNCTPFWSNFHFKPNQIVCFGKRECGHLIGETVPRMANQIRNSIPFRHAKAGTFIQARPRLENPYLGDGFLQRILRRLIPENEVILCAKCWLPVIAEIAF